MQTTRYEQGWQKLSEIDGDAGQAVIESLADICPDLGRYIIEFPFGDIYQRGNLSLQQRELITIAILAALGHCRPQLIVHINGALNVGCQPQAIIETILQLSVYAGFPAAINGMLAVKEVFIERGVSIDNAADSVGCKPMSSNSGYLITAEIRATIDDSERVTAALRELQQQTLAEPGCQVFFIHQDKADKKRYMMWEQFDDEVAFKQHFEYAHTRDYLALSLTEVVQAFKTVGI